MQKFYLRTKILYPLKYKNDKMLASEQVAVNISLRPTNRCCNVVRVVLGL